MAVIREYFNLQAHFAEKYGEQTVVLMQIGSFYEVYEYSVARQGEIIDVENISNIDVCIHLNDGRDVEIIKGGNIGEIGTKDIGKTCEIGVILNMHITSKDKSKPHSFSNPIFVGFPCASIHLHKERILMAGYTVIIVDQYDLNGGVARKVTDISCPSITTTPLSSSNSNNNILSIYIECAKYSKNFDKNVLLIGVSCIDVHTGQSVVGEVYSKTGDEVFALQEAYRFIVSSLPREVLLYVKGAAAEFVDYVKEKLDLHKYTCNVVKTEVPADYFQLPYQEQILQKAFGEENKGNVLIPVNGAASMIDVLDLEAKHYGRISYIILLQYCYEHDETVIERLLKPDTTWIDSNSHCILTHNAIQQFDILPQTSELGLFMASIRSKSKKKTCLLHLLDNTLTKMGARYFASQLLNPITDATKLNSLYALSAELLANEELSANLSALIKQVPDIEHYHRKLKTKVIVPKDFAILFSSYDVILKIYMQIYNHTLKNPVAGAESVLQKLFFLPSVCSQFNGVFFKLKALFNFGACREYSWTLNPKTKGKVFESVGSIFNKGAYGDIDQLDTNIKSFENILEQILVNLNTLTGNSRGKDIEMSVEKEKNESHCCIHTTLTKSRLLKGNPGLDIALCGELVFTTMKSKIYITSDKITYYIDNIEKLKVELNERMYKYYLQIVNEISIGTYFGAVNQFVAELDFLLSNVRTSKKYNYFRPTILPNSDGNSFIVAKDLRHPLSEQLIRSKYISNDISLGERNLGMLLYGVNSSGKTCLAKAVGIAILMAQAGLYVAGEIKFCPFDNIITRLSGNDDLIKGESSFIVEMSELRTILRNATCRSLVLGDELCRGTETISGTSLTVATIDTLIERKTCFIFSTHMHNLTSVSNIEEHVLNNKLGIWHLSAYFDEALEQMVYNRKLTPNQGKSTYGIEVCKSLGISKEFIEKANRIRRNIAGVGDEFVSTKTSRYNSSVYMDRCSLCGAQSSSVDRPLDTHHISEQALANKEGLIENFHKNTAWNLLVLCKSCHEHIHQNKSYFVQKQTLNGTYLSGGHFVNGASASS